MIISTFSVFILGCWKRKKTKNSEFVLMMMRMKKREGSVSQAHGRNSSGMMKSGLNNSDIKQIHDLSYSLQLAVKHFGVCVLFTKHL